MIVTKYGHVLPFRSLNAVSHKAVNSILTPLVSSISFISFLLFAALLLSVLGTPNIDLNNRVLGRLGFGACKAHSAMFTLDFGTKRLMSLVQTLAGSEMLCFKKQKHFCP